MRDISELLQGIGLTVMGSVGCCILGGILFQPSDEDLGRLVWNMAKRHIMDSESKDIKVIMVDDKNNRLMFTVTNETTTYTVLIKKEEK